MERLFCRPTMVSPRTLTSFHDPDHDHGTRSRGPRRARRVPSDPEPSRELPFALLLLVLPVPWSVFGRPSHFGLEAPRHMGTLSRHPATPASLRSLKWRHGSLGATV